MSYENKKPLLMSFESIPIVLRYEVSECMVKITITKLNGGYIDIKLSKLTPPKMVPFTKKNSAASISFRIA